MRSTNASSTEHDTESIILGAFRRLAEQLIPEGVRSMQDIAIRPFDSWGPVAYQVLRRECL